ncbi:MAG TPA: NAD(P)-dependent oxidoreductase [Acidimicrobiia bacterium]
MIGFVGLGRMGLPIARNIAAGGHDIRCVDVVGSAVERALASGLDATTDLGALEGADVVLTSLPDTPEVAGVFLEPGNLLEAMADGGVAVDLSTISIDGSRAIAEEAAARRRSFLDAPLSGSVPHAESKTLAVMVGGEAGALATVMPVLASMSSSVHHMGGNGAGLVMKLITNRLLAASVAALAEAVVQMEANDIDVDAGLGLLAAGAVPKLIEYKGPALRDREYRAAFTIDLMRKDMGHASGLAGGDRLASVVEQVFDEASRLGHGDGDIAAIIETWLVKEGPWRT